MGKRPVRAIVAVLSASLVTVVAGAAPAEGRSPSRPAPTRTVAVSFEGGCESSAVGLTPPELPGGSAELVVPRRVRPGAEVTIPVATVLGQVPPPPHDSANFATASWTTDFAVTGATPAAATVGTSGDTADWNLRLTVTGRPGSSVEIRLTGVLATWSQQVPTPIKPVFRGYHIACEPVDGPEVTATIRIAGRPR